MKKIMTIVALFAAIAAAEAQERRSVQFFAHRGSRFEYDENTMPAF